MNKINKKIRILFAFSLILSIGLPLGIVGIVFGAMGNVALLVGGILLTVSGFYVMPILWVQFGDRIVKRRILRIILNDHLYTVKEIAEHTGYIEREVILFIKYLINSGCLTGFIFDNESLKINTNKKQAVFNTKVKCPNCGANLTSTGIDLTCNYCGLELKSKDPEIK